MTLLTALERQGGWRIAAVGYGLIAVVGTCDYITGYEIAFSLFYVIPIFLIGWFQGHAAGIAASVISAVVWLWADAAAGHTYTSAFVPVWNTLIRLSFFVVFTWLLASLRAALEREKALSRLDAMTGAVASRFFFEILEAEIQRSWRYLRPFVLAYVDLDNFKAVNDRHGHAEGDRALRTIVAYAREHLRVTDVVARLGGDEFALLLPETDEQAARTALSHLRNGLILEMQRRGWPITFSIGVVLCRGVEKSADDLVRAADALMYEVKRGSKNALAFSTIGSEGVGQ